MACQEADFWCWAAVTECIDAFKGGNLSQAVAATTHVSTGQPGAICTTGDPGTSVSACGTPCKGACNSPHRLSLVLSDCGHPVNTTNIATISFQDIVNVIDSGKLLPLRMNITTGSGGGHFICIVGYSDDGQGNEFVEVLDPLVPGVGLGPAAARDIPFSTFVNGGYTINGDLAIPNFRYDLV